MNTDNDNSNRGLRRRKAMSQAIDNRLVIALATLSYRENKPQSRLLDEAIVLLCKEYGQEIMSELPDLTETNQIIKDIKKQGTINLTK